MDINALFDLSAKAQPITLKSVWLDGSLDPHIHCRPKHTGQMQMVVERCAREHEAIIDIANVPNVHSVEQIEQRLSEINSCIPDGESMQVFIAPLVNDKTDPTVIRAAHKKKLIKCIKIFWQGVSNDYGNSISRAAAIRPLIKSTTRSLEKGEAPVVVSMHAECAKDYKGREIPIKDREFWCVRNEVSKIVKTNPGGVYVIRHISDYRTIEWIKDMRRQGYNIHGEICPQYLILIDDDLFKSDSGHASLQCNCVFWPRPKDKHSQLKLRQELLKGYRWLHIGTDYALHLEDFTQLSGVKINARGEAAGGLNFEPAVAKSLVIDFFLANGRQELINPMLSGNAAALYGIELSGNKYEYVREDWTVADYTHGTVPGKKRGTERSVKSANFLRGKVMHWKRAVG